MLAAEVQEEAADAVLTRADVSSETYTEASSDEGESQPFEPGESPDETAGLDDPDEAESGQPDVPAEPSGDPDAPPQDDDA